jgi:polyamine:H+ symporter
MLATPSNGVNLPVFLSYLAFTHSGLENLGSLVEDTRQPEKTMFKAIAPAMMTSFLVYFLPIATAVSALNVADHDFSAWKPGYWGHVAGVIGGEGFERYMEWGGVIARFAALLGTTATSARLLAGMGSMNAFPSVMSNFLAMYHDTRFTPVNSIIVVSATALPFTVLLGVNDLVAVVQVLSSVRILLCVYAPFFLLRYKHPHLPRPYRFPFGFKSSIAILAPSVVFVAVVGVCAAMLGVAALSISVAALVLSAVAAVLLVKYLRPDGLAGQIEEFELNEVPPSSFIEDDADDDGGNFGALY